MKMKAFLPTFLAAMSIYSFGLAQVPEVIYKNVHKGDVVLQYVKVNGSAGGTSADAAINSAIEKVVLRQMYGTMQKRESVQTATQKVDDFLTKEAALLPATRIRRVAAVLQADMAAQLQEDRGYGVPYEHYTYDSKAKVFYNGDRYLSLMQGLYTFFGGAHGNTLFTTLNFDTQTGKLLRLLDLFIPGSNYLQKINELVDREEAKEAGGLFGDVVVDDEVQFYLTEQQELVLAYQPYDVACYARGTVLFTLPFGELQDYLAISY